jgi:predicted enzyme related to lactoylglutathione lyase
MTDPITDLPEPPMTPLPNPVGWFELHVENLVRAQAFYEAVFDRSLVNMPSGDPLLQMLIFEGKPGQAGAVGALVQHPMKKPSTEGALVYFSCLDCAVQIQRAMDHGGCIYKSKTSIGPNGFIAIIGDSEGNAIGLHSLQ